MSDSWIFSLSSQPSLMHHSSLSNSTAVISSPGPLTSPSSFQGHGHHPHTKVASNHLTDPQEGSPHLPHLQVTSPHLHPPQVTSPHLVPQPQVTSPNFHHGQVTPSHLPHCQVTSPHIPHSQVTSPHIPHSQVTSPLLSSHQFTDPHLFQQPQVTSHQYIPQSQISPSYHLTHPQTTSPHFSYPHVTSPHFVQPQVTSPHIVTQPQMTSPHQNHFSSPNHNTGLDNQNWSQCETSPELSCLLNSYTYSYQIQSTANLDVNLQNQGQINTSVNHQLENTHRMAYNANTFPDGGVYGQGGTPGPVENTWEPLEPALSELQCSPLNSMSEGATLGKWSSIDFSSSSTEDFSNTQFFPESYHDNNASPSFCSPTTPGPSPHYPQTPTISSPGPQMHPRKERLSFSTQATTQLNINKPPICCLHDSNSYPVTPDPGQHHPNETSTCLLPSQSEPIQEQSCFSPQGKGQDISSAAQPSSVLAGLNWKEESGGRGRRRGGGRGGGDSKPDWTRMKPPRQENASRALNSRLQCMVCKRDFRSLPALNGHMRSHSGVRASTCIKKGEDSSSHILPSASLVMPVSVPVQSRGASKACRTGQRRCSRPPPATGGAVLYRSLMHLKEEDAVTSGNKGVASYRDGKAFTNDDKTLDGARCHYTPPPMLCPLRAGTGLYCSLTTKSQQRVQLHNTHNGLNEPVAIETLTTGINKPRINIGRGFQAQIPPLRDHKCVYSDSHNALLLWTPWDELEHAVNQKRVEAVLRMTGSSVMPGGGASPEYALHVRVEEAMSPLQLSVYWRLSLVFIFTSFLFFLDVFATAVAAATCNHGNASRGMLPSNVGTNQSRPADWRTRSGKAHSVCGWTDWLSYGQTLFMAGLLLGSLFGGAVSDRYGKRPVLLVCVCVHALCGLVPAVLPRPFVFLAVRCLTGVCCCCINICSFSLAVEWTPPASRLWPPAFLPFCFSLGTMAGAPLAWLSPTWTQLHLSLSLPQLICLPLYFSIPESPRWLSLKRRNDVLDRYRSNSPADKQRLDLLLDSAWSDLQKATEAQKEEAPGDQAPRHSIHHLRHPTILLRLFIMSYLSAASALTYFGICMNIGSFGVGVYAAQFFSGLSEAPCLLVPLVRLGRRPLSMLSLFLSGVACLVSLLLSSHYCEPVIVMSLALLGKLCILAAIFISTLYSIELFPTVVRQRCVSLVNLCFRLGCLANALVPPSPSGAITLTAMIVYSSGPIVGCGLCLLLPETSGVTLPDSVEDCDRQPRPRPPSLEGLRRTLKLGGGQTRKPETASAEKDDTANTHTGLL